MCFRSNIIKNHKNNFSLKLDTQISGDNVNEFFHARISDSIYMAHVNIS